MSARTPPLTSCPEPPETPPDVQDLVGLAFSGGGIRSASFDLGCSRVWPNATCCGCSTISSDRLRGRFRRRVVECVAVADGASAAGHLPVRGRAGARPARGDRGPPSIGRVLPGRPGRSRRFTHRATRRSDRLPASVFELPDAQNRSVQPYTCAWSVFSSVTPALHLGHPARRFCWPRSSPARPTFSPPSRRRRRFSASRTTSARARWSMPPRALATDDQDIAWSPDYSLREISLKPAPGQPLTNVIPIRRRDPPEAPRPADGAGRRPRMRRSRSGRGSPTALDPSGRAGALAAGDCAGQQARSLQRAERAPWMSPDREVLLPLVILLVVADHFLQAFTLCFGSASTASAAAAWEAFPPSPGYLSKQQAAACGG